MHTASSRTSLALAALLAASSLGACTYEPLTGNVTISVTNIPPDADHLKLLLTDSAAKTYERFPSFGQQQFDGIPLELTIQVDNPGVLTATLTALNHDQTALGEATVTGNLEASSTLALSAALATTNLDGTYGKPCLTSGVACSGVGLECKKYTGTDRGICTVACPPSCSATITPQASCIAFPGTVDTFCQWDCTTAACPTGLTCGALISGKKYCQGSN